MRLFFLASLVSAATAMTCSIVGEGAGLCRSCPATGCPIVVEIPKGETRDFTCVWRMGENQAGDTSWMYLPSSSCFVARSRTDCAAQGNLVGGCNVVATQGIQ